MAGALLEQAEVLLDKGIHPMKIADGFDLACKKALEILDLISDTFPIENRDLLVQSALTSLGSKMYGPLSNFNFFHLNFFDNAFSSII